MQVKDTRMYRVKGMQLYLVPLEAYQRAPVVHGARVVAL